jgi:HK97 family phage major capsid protein
MSDRDGPTLDELLVQVKADIAELEGDWQAAGRAPLRAKGGHAGTSRFVSDRSSEAVVKHVQAGGSYTVVEPRSRVWPESGRKAPGDGTSLLRAVTAAKLGDPDAAKGWVEGIDASGGYLVKPEQLPGYVEVRRAASPLRDRCTVFDVKTNEVWVVTEGNTVTVQHLAEAATKPDTTGTVGQKVSTVFKVAGTSHVSDELLADTNGLAGDLVARQFGQQIGIAIDTAIISGTGTGQPTGIRNTAGVNAQAVDGQTGAQLRDSVLKAGNRIAQKFYQADVAVLHPRDIVKFQTAKDSQGQYLFPSLDGLFGSAEVVVDANIPTNLGAGTNESVILVGAFKPGAYFFQRQALTIDSSRAAGWTTDETVLRGVERYGFAVVVPGCFEVLTGVLP